MPATLSGVGGEDLAQGGDEGIGVAGLAVFTAEEPAVMAGSPSLRCSLSLLLTTRRDGKTHR
jgi:hypothetical protein